MPSPPKHRAPLLIPQRLTRALLALYDYPDPRKPGRKIRGYDTPHALRTARMCAAVAQSLGHSKQRIYDYQIACLLHDLGRAGLDQKLFGTIWSWARRQGIPTRPREWRAVYPGTRYGRETEAFISRYGHDLREMGVALDDWTREQVEMRLGYAHRLARQLRIIKPKLARLGVRWKPWMMPVMLYYYYPEKLKTALEWVRELAQILVACEQFEAYSNQRRGRDYYTRAKENLAEAFAYLDKLRIERILSDRVVNAVRQLAAQGAFDEILRQARGVRLSSSERKYLRALPQR
jgi:hypothetical protein